MGCGEGREPERRSGCDASCTARRAAAVVLADRVRTYLEDRGAGRGERDALADALAVVDRAEVAAERAERTARRVRAGLDAQLAGTRG